MCVSVFVCMLVFASFSSVCITVYHSVYLPFCLSCLSVSPCVPYLSVCQSECIHTCQSVSPCVPYLSVCQSVCIHTCQSECQSVCFHTCQSVTLCVSTPVSLSVCVFPYLSVCLSCLSDFCVYVWLKGKF